MPKRPPKYEETTLGFLTMLAAAENISPGLLASWLRAHPEPKPRNLAILVNVVKVEKPESTTFFSGHEDS